MIKQNKLLNTTIYLEGFSTQNSWTGQVLLKTPQDRYMQALSISWKQPLFVHIAFFFFTVKILVCDKEIAGSAQRALPGYQHQNSLQTHLLYHGIEHEHRVQTSSASQLTESTETLDKTYIVPLGEVVLNQDIYIYLVYVQ